MLRDLTGSIVKLSSRGDLGMGRWETSRAALQSTWCFIPMAVVLRVP
jgi:hypothetical protein